MADGINSEVASQIARILANANRYAKNVEDGCRAAMGEIVELIASDAKTNHAYTDRTANLTNSIIGFVEEVTPLLVQGVIQATMDYAAFVELCRDGKYAFLAPAIEAHEDDIVRILERHLSR